MTAAVLTVSDSCARGDRVDLSGPAVSELLRKKNFSLIGTEVVSDDQAAIQNQPLPIGSRKRNSW